LAMILACIFEGKACNPSGGLLRNDLQALDYARNHLVLDSRIQALRVLPDYDQIDLGVARRNMGQVANWAKIGVELKLLAQRHVDAGKALANGRGDGSFQADV